MQVFLSSIQELFGDLSINKVIMLIMAFFTLLGGWDRIRGNKRGYGEQFEEGFYAMGPLALSVVGMIAWAPVIRIVLGDALGGFFKMIGADPSLFAGILLGTDLGGYPLAMELAETEAVGLFTGLIVSTLMGINIVFNIPVGMGSIEESDRVYFSSGMLLGIATVPVGCIAGGFIMQAFGFPLGTRDILMNTLFIAIVALLIVLGLLFKRDAVLKGFIAFGKGVTVFITVGLVLAAFQYLSGIKLPLFHVMVEENAEGTVPILEGLAVVGAIGVVLLGAFPMVLFITKNAGGFLKKVGGKIGLDETSMAGLIANLANSIPVFNMMKDMNPKGKIVNSAFVVSASFALGDHLGFCAGVNQEMIVPMIVAKLAGGIAAIIAACFLWKRFAPDKG